MFTKEPHSDSPEPPLIAGFMRLLDYPELASARALADWILARLDQGLFVFDHADIYGGGQCEIAFGEALRTLPKLKKRVQVITKADIVAANRDTSRWQVKHYRAEANYLTGAIDGALQRLAVDDINTFLIHRPDPLMQASEVAHVLEKAVDAGKIRHIGVSNFLPEQWRWLQQNTRLPLVCNQSQLSLGHSQPLFDGTHEAHLRDGLRWLAWSPLAGGKLGEGQLADTLARATEETGLSATALAIAWLRQIPGGPVPVIGSLRSERIDDALEGARATLPRSLWFALLEAARGKAVA